MTILVEEFVNGKVQKKFADISRATEEFFTELEPVIAEVYVTLQAFEAKTNGNTLPNEIPDTLRKDLEGARKGLAQYNRIFGRVDTQLAIISSNFNLKRFLEENGVPSDQLREFQYELSEYWQVTYGDMINGWWTIRNKLNELRGILELEVKMLEAIPTIPFAKGCVENPELRKLFYKERSVFYESMELYKATNDAILSKVSAKLEVEFARAKSEFSTQIKMIKNDVKYDTATGKTKIQKTLVVLLYLIGAYTVLSDIKRTTKNYGISKVAKLIRSALSKSTSSLDDKSKRLLGIKGDVEKTLSGQLIELVPMQRIFSALS